MGKIIKELNDLNIKLNITAIYSAKQTEKILKLINKKLKLLFQYLQAELVILEKIQFQNLKRV